ncbi:hypothetical protein FACS189450_02990 [Spirochaetia bacterium]|nr:hypothetical protein FACS189450_02990 [Spirochaetia bacterium]
MANNERDVHILRKSYQPIAVGNSYRPIPEKGEQIKTFVPPTGGTGAKTMQIETVSPSASTQKK